MAGSCIVLHVCVLSALRYLYSCDLCDTSFLIRFRTHSRLERAGACRGKAPPSCLRKTALPLKSPTGAFIATQTRSCRKVQNGEDLFPMKIFTAPQHTRSILPPFHPTKSSLRCMGGIFLFRGKLHFENFMSRPDVIPTFRQRRCTNRGRNFVRSKRWSPYMSSTTSTYFFAS